MNYDKELYGGQLIVSSFFGIGIPRNSRSLNHQLLVILFQIEKIDDAIRNLVDLRDGVETSHVPHPETEQALVDLLVQRCKLLIVVGYIDKVLLLIE